MESRTATPDNASAQATQDHDKGFLDTALDRSEALPQRYGLESTDVHVAGNVTLDEVLEYRAAILSDDVDSQDVAPGVEMIVDTRLPKLDDQDPKYFARIRERTRLGDMLLASDKSFEKQTAKLVKQEARNRGISPRLGRRNRGESGAIAVSVAEAGKSPDVRAELKQAQRERREVAKSHNGLVGRLNDEGWTDEELSTIHKSYWSRIGSAKQKGADMDKPHVYTESARLAAAQIVAEKVAASDFADEDEAKRYEEQLNQDIHQYVSNTGDERKQLDEARVRHRELNVQVAELEAHPELQERRRSKRRLLGATGLFGAGLKNVRERWSNRRNKRDADDIDTAAGNDEQLDDDGQYALFSEDEFRTDERRNKTRLRDKPLEFLVKRRNNRDMKRQAEADRVAAMSDDERRDYYAERREKRNNRKAAAVIGAVAVAGALYAAHKAGVDLWPFNNGDIPQGGGDVTPDPGTGSEGVTPGQETAPETTIEPEKPTPGTGNEAGDRDTGDGAGRGSEQFSRNELFDGRGGSRRLTAENISELRDFMDNYRVKDADNRGVWGIAEKYLDKQGISNPTVYEIDSVKDYILEHSRLTEKSIIYPGDTIKLR